MHNFVTTAKSNFNNQTVQTMSSREIAELCGKQHAHIMRDIRQMLEELNGSKFGLVDFIGTYVDAKGESRPCYNLPKRECLILVSGYNMTLRARIIDRWQELEKQVVAPQIDYSSPKAMIGFLNYLQGQIDQKDSIIEDLTPKAMALESLQRHDGLFGLTEAAKILEIQPKQFIQFLQQKGWIYRRAAGGNLLPYQDKIQKQLMDCPTITLQTASGIEKVIPCAKITTKGMGLLSQELKRQSMH
ncbi:Rha family transcriptional regulator [Bartonella mastomydis]|uniref:Rha family transcriptional regulator n=1 Tax=Bartonella mastomydis TaxID=1820002 RepID=UPI001115C658|nr:phage regulatory protein/antirepressor Ant [Bartonella mastomydis]